MSLFADLHVHTTNSDGELDIADVPAVAKEVGLSVVAITDHDSIHPELESAVSTVDGVTLIRSIELRVNVPSLDERVDLLGYGVETTSDLTQELQRLQDDRRTRSQRMIERVENQLDITLGIEGREGMGRPHIANAIIEHPETDYTEQQVFDEIIGRDCDAYVSRDVTKFQTGVNLLLDACAFVGLAHPFRYENPKQAISLTKHLDAIEGPYPYSRGLSAMNESTFVDAVRNNDLLVTGGSDAHNTTLGKSGLTDKQFNDIRPVLGLD